MEGSAAAERVQPAPWALVDLVAVAEDRGLLVAFDMGRHVPFDVRRIFYVKDVPAGGVRGQHANPAQEFLVCVAGGVDVDLDDGTLQERIRLDSPSGGVWVAPMVWVELRNFSPDAVLLVLASEPYDAGSTVRDHTAFLRMVQGAR